jgi:hypothetical protein
MSQVTFSQFQSKLNHRDLRRRPRYAVDAGALQVSWINAAGNMETARTRALNVSENGIALQLPSAALPTRVRFQSHRFNLYGAGSVKYCRRTGAKYVIGVEFVEDLHWSPPTEDIPEPIPLCDPESAYPPIFL